MRPSVSQKHVKIIYSTLKILSEWYERVVAEWIGYRILRSDILCWLPRLHWLLFLRTDSEPIKKSIMLKEDCHLLFKNKGISNLLGIMTRHWSSFRFNCQNFIVILLFMQDLWSRDPCQFFLDPFHRSIKVDKLLKSNCLWPLL